MGNTAIENFNLRRLGALYHLQQALIAGGYEVMSIKVVRDPDTREENVVVKFLTDTRKGPISMRTALEAPFTTY